MAGGEPAGSGLGWWALKLREAAAEAPPHWACSPGPQAQWDPSMAARLAAASAGYTRSRNRMGMGRQGILEAIP